LGSEPKPSPLHERRWVRAFAVGAAVHLILLGFASFELLASDLAAILLFVFALPGALVDVSAEVIHPSKLGSAALVAVATAVNGAAYAAGAALLARARR
jgi:multisubunit Na+/H+ antiporter MnhE subunit